MTDYHADLMNLVQLDVDDDYEGTGTNNRILGHMYHLKQYSKAADLEYDRLRKELDVPQPEETTTFQTDGKYSATVQPRAGRRSIDEESIARLIGDLVFQLRSKENNNSGAITRVKAGAEAAVMMTACYKYSKPSYAVSIVRSASDE